MTMATPVPEIERSSLIPWIVLICSSSRWATWVSVSSVEAPGSSTRTLTVGRSTVGKRSTPSRNQLAAPMTTKPMTSMVANTGRLMQTSASFCMAVYGTTVTGWPPTRLPGTVTTGSPRLSPSTISTSSPRRRPVVTRTSAVLP